MWHAWGRGEACTGFWWGKLRGRDHVEDLGVDGMIILKSMRAPPPFFCYLNTRISLLCALDSRDVQIPSHQFLLCCLIFVGS